MRNAWIALGGAALVALAPLAAAQDDPCPAGAPVPCSYRVSPIPNGYASILGAGGTVVLGFAAGADDASLPIAFPGGFAFNFFCAPQAGPLAVCTNGFANFGAASTAFTNHHGLIESPDAKFAGISATHALHGSSRGISRACGELSRPHDEYTPARATRTRPLIAAYDAPRELGHRGPPLESP